MISSSCRRGIVGARRARLRRATTGGGGGEFLEVEESFLGTAGRRRRKSCSSACLGREPIHSTLNCGSRNEKVLNGGSVEAAVVAVVGGGQGRGSSATLTRRRRLAQQGPLAMGISMRLPPYPLDGSKSSRRVSSSSARSSISGGSSGRSVSRTSTSEQQHAYSSSTKNLSSIAVVEGVYRSGGRSSSSSSSSSSSNSTCSRRAAPSFRSFRSLMTVAALASAACCIAVPSAATCGDGSGGSAGSVSSQTHQQQTPASIAASKAAQAATAATAAAAAVSASAASTAWGLRQKLLAAGAMASSSSYGGGGGGGSSLSNRINGSVSINSRMNSDCLEAGADSTFSSNIPISATSFMGRTETTMRQSSGDDISSGGSSGSGSSSSTSSAGGGSGRAAATTASGGKHHSSPVTPLFTSAQATKGHRSYMEDEFFVALDGRFAAVFDGHGGAGVSKYLRQNLYAQLQSRLQANKRGGNSSTTSEGAAEDSSNSSDGGDNSESELPQQSKAQLIEAMRAAFAQVDEEVSQVGHWRFQGSTAVAVALHHDPETGESSLVTGNVGDSRAVLSRRGRAIELTQDHKPNSESELKRIEDLNGTVSWFGFLDPDTGAPIEGTGVYRINGNLAVARAIGDSSERPFVSGECEIRSIPSDSEGDQFVIVASDGLWDVMSSDAAVQYVQAVMQGAVGALREGNSCTGRGGEGSDRLRPVNMKLSDWTQRYADDRGMIRAAMMSRKRKMARYLTEEAIRRGTMDNVTVVIVWLS